MQDGPDPSVFAPEPYVIRHKKGSGYKLTPTQKFVLDAYFSQYLEEGFKSFIICAPQVPIDLRPLRAFLILKALTADIADYMALLNQFYPVVGETDATFEQNKYFRELLEAFNKLCRGQIDINHPLYSQIFDPRLSPDKLNSPTKRNLVANFFIRKVEPFVRDFVPFVTASPIYREADTWFLQMKFAGREDMGSSERRISRRLFD